MSCKHEQFEVASRVGRLTDSEDSEVITGYVVDIKVQCGQCGLPFEWIGVPGGYSPGQPMSSADGYELRAPIRPSSDPVEHANQLLKS